MVRAAIEFFEVEKPDLGEPIWTPKQRKRLVNGFIVFIVCKDFDERFKDKKNLDAQFWRTICHRTFGYGDPADAKINSWDCKKEFFRLKDIYLNVDMASQYNDDLQVEDYSTEDFGIIEGEKWGGDYGVEDGESVENGERVEAGQRVEDGQRVILVGEVKDEEREDDEMTDVGHGDGGDGDGQRTPTGPHGTEGLDITLTPNGSQFIAAQADAAPRISADRSTVPPSTVTQSVAAPSVFSPPQSTPQAAPQSIADAFAVQQTEKGELMVAALINLYDDSILTDEGRINWHAILDHEGMNDVHLELLQSYSLMVKRASDRARYYWMKRLVEEYVGMGGVMVGDVDGCFIPHI